MKQNALSRAMATVFPRSSGATAAAGAAGAAKSTAWRCQSAGLRWPSGVVARASITDCP